MPSFHCAHCLHLAAAEERKPLKLERALAEKATASKTRRKESRSSSAAESSASPAAEGEATEASEERVQGQDSEDKLQRTLFVGNLPVRDRFKPNELYRHLGLSKMQVESMRLRSVPIAAQFHKCRRAAIARQQFSLPPFRGRELRLDSATRKGFSLFDRKRSVCVGGLPKDATESDLKQGLSYFGPVENSRVVRDKVTRMSKGFGFVCFADRGSATKAVLAATCTILAKPNSPRPQDEFWLESHVCVCSVHRQERKMQKRQINRATKRGEGAGKGLGR
ncbi:hypothetical protein Emed_001490 [Eimeria media]